MLIAQSRPCIHQNPLFFPPRLSSFVCNMGWGRVVSKVNLSWQASFIFYMCLKLIQAQSSCFLQCQCTNVCPQPLTRSKMSVPGKLWNSSKNPTTHTKAFFKASPLERCRGFGSAGQGRLCNHNPPSLVTHLVIIFYTVFIPDQVSNHGKDVFTFLRWLG